MDILGIDIGTVSVKYVRCKGTKNIVSKGDYPYSGDLDDLEMIFSDIKVKEGTNLEVLIGITSEDIIKKTFTIPILPKKEQKEVLNWSTTKILTTPLEDMVYEYLMLGEVDEKGVKKEEVLFVGTRKEYVNSVLSVLKRAEFKQITLITDIAFTYNQAINGEGKGSVAVIDVGGRRTGLYIYDAKNLMFAREILTASESFSDALMSGSGYSYDEAEQYKREKGFNEELTEVLRLPFERLDGEIQRTFSVYNQRYPDKPISKVFIAGRGANIPNFFERLKDSMVEEVGYLTVPVGIESEFIPTYALCMGRDLFPNLLPKEIKERGKEESYKGLIRIGTIVIGAILVILSFNVLSTLNKVNMMVGIGKANLSKKMEGLKVLGVLPSSSFSYAELSAIRSEIQKKDITFITLLKYLSSRLPNDVYLKTVEFSSEAQAETPATAGIPKTPPVQPPPATTAGQPQGLPKLAPFQALTKAVSNDYTVTMKGYVFGEPDTLEVTLFNFIITLKKSGFMQNVDVVSKEIKTIKGKKVIEFSITARCLRYEV